MLELERAAWLAGYRRVAGVDEAGRGSLAGPVVAACVVADEATLLAWQGLTDSKKLTARARDHFYNRIRNEACSIGVGVIDAATVDQVNILQATFEAMREAIFQCEPVEFVLVDGPLRIPNLLVAQSPEKRGDARSISIAAASVIAKVTRDRLMVQAHQVYPAYEFARHKGYGTVAHFEALKRFGPSEIHRKTFLKRVALTPCGGMMSACGEPLPGGRAGSARGRENLREE